MHLNKVLLSLLLLLLSSNIILAQDLTGVWTGEIIQRGNTDIIRYSMTLEQDGDKVFGTSTSSVNGVSAKFEVGGIWGGEMLTIQEVRQILPEDAKWCLKHIRLKGKYINRQIVLRGDWEAEGCSPGTMVLSQLLIIEEAKPGTVVTPLPKAEHPFPALGKFVGVLSQSDREYGFYFELNLNADGTGTNQNQFR